MKSTFKLKGIEIEGIKIGEIEFQQEYSMSEAINAISYGKVILRDIIKELPELIDDLEIVRKKVEEVNTNEKIEYFKKRLSNCKDFKSYEEIKKDINNENFSGETVKALTSDILDSLMSLHKR